MPLLTIFRALADPSRVRILLLVRRMELSVGELPRCFGQSQPRVSRHIRILADAGLVRRAKEGAWVFVRLGDAARDRAGAGRRSMRWRPMPGRPIRSGWLRCAPNARRPPMPGSPPMPQDWDRERALYIAEIAVEAAICATALGADGHAAGPSRSISAPVPGG